MPTLADKVAVVTGASKGIGAEIARALAREDASVVVNDATDSGGAQRVVSEIVAEGGRAIAVCADVSRRDDVRRLFEATANLGPLLAMQAAVEQFGADGGSIVNIGSAITTRPLPNSTLYTASKGALDAGGAALAIEVGHRGIRVNTVLPGPVQTAQLDPYGEEDRALMASMAVLGRLGLPSDIAPIVVFLASDASGWITAETICAAGGLR